MLSPKKVKFRKQQKGRMKGTARRGSQLNFGEFGLQATECGRISARQIEAARVAMTRHAKRGGKMWIRIFPDTPITKSLKGLSLRSALNLVLRDLSLTWIIRDEVLLITTPKEAESNLTTKVYDVYDLVVCYDEDDEPWDDYDTLINQITTNIRPMTWDDVGGPASITGASLGTAKVLIVSQTRDVHPEIAALFEDIREIAQQNPDAELPQRNKPVIRPEPSIGSFDDPIDPAGKDK